MGGAIQCGGAHDLEQNWSEGPEQNQNMTQRIRRKEGNAKKEDSEQCEKSVSAAQTQCARRSGGVDCCLRLLFGGELAGGFDDLAGEIVHHAGFVASLGEIGGAEELLLAIAEHVADALLHLRIGELALPGGLPGDELEDDVTVAESDGVAHFARLE